MVLKVLKIDTFKCKLHLNIVTVETLETRKTEIVNKIYLELLRKITRIVKEAELELRKFQEDKQNGV